jgi:hypothetical protein
VPEAPGRRPGAPACPNRADASRSVSQAGRPFPPDSSTGADGASPPWRDRGRCRLPARQREAGINPDGKMVAPNGTGSGGTSPVKNLAVFLSPYSAAGAFEHAAARTSPFTRREECSVVGLISRRMTCCRSAQWSIAPAIMREDGTTVGAWAQLKGRLALQLADPCRTEMVATIAIPFHCPKAC